MAKLSERDRERLSIFVDEMVAQRTHRGWSQADLAREVKYSKSLIAQVETYERAPTEPLAVSLDSALGLPKTFVRLYGKIRGTAFPAAFGEFAVYEAQAVALWLFEHAYVPGLLQTEGYARAALSHHYNVTADQVAERVTARLERQQLLGREDPPPPNLWILVDEFVLHREIGSAEVMAQQLDVLAATAGTNVTVQVIPRSTGAHPGLAGMFHIAELGDGSSILFREDITDGSVTDDPATVSDAAQRWQHLSSLALNVGQSQEIIRECAEQWRKIAATNGGKRLTAVPTGPASKSASQAE